MTRRRAARYALMGWAFICSIGATAGAVIGAIEIHRDHT